MFFTLERAHCCRSVRSGWSDVGSWGDGRHPNPSGAQSHSTGSQIWQIGANLRVRQLPLVLDPANFRLPHVLWEVPRFVQWKTFGQNIPTITVFCYTLLVFKIYPNYQKCNMCNFQSWFSQDMFGQSLQLMQSQISKYDWYKRSHLAPESLKKGWWP